MDSQTLNHIQKKHSFLFSCDICKSEMLKEFTSNSKAADRVEYFQMIFIDSE